jgi:hypothetical protein
MWDSARYKQPALVLCDEAGNARLYLPQSHHLQQPPTKTTVTIPLGEAAGSGWTTRDTGPFDPTRVKRVELLVQPLNGIGAYDLTFNFNFSRLGFATQ